MSFAATAPAPRSHASGSVTAIVRHFTPNWFAATMGTGILALTLNQFPLAHPTLHIAAVALWFVNIALFASFTVLYASRWLLFPREAARIFEHPVVSMFFGCIPMGLATIINGFLAFGPAFWGPDAIAIANGLWWIDAAISVVIGLGVPFLMFTRQDHGMEKMTAVWLLPIVAAEVAAASGAQLVPHLADAHAALRVEILGYMLWAYSVPLAMSILVVLLLRLILHKLPHADMAASMWLSLGPIGTASLGLLLLGADAPAVFAANGLPQIGAVAQGIGLVGGAVFWGYGIWWLGLATITTARYLRAGMSFNLGWWGFTFPLGVYTAATFALAGQTHLGFIRTAGAIFVLCLATFWTIVATRTLKGALDRTLFADPTMARRAAPTDFEADAV